MYKYYICIYILYILAYSGKHLVSIAAENICNRWILEPKSAVVVFLFHMTVVETVSNIQNFIIRSVLSRREKETTREKPIFNDTSLFMDNKNV